MFWFLLSNHKSGRHPSAFIMWHFYHVLRTVIMRKKVNIIIVLILSQFLYTCTHLEKPKEKSGEIIMEVATRGSYQFLISIDGKPFWPENLPVEFLHPGLKVKVKYTEKGYLKNIYKPAPNDVPVKDYLAPAIYLLEIEKN